MFITPYFGGCKYTNKFLFINKNIVFQHFGLLITFPFPLPPRPPFGTVTDSTKVLSISCLFRKRRRLPSNCTEDNIPMQNSWKTYRILVDLQQISTF